MRMYNLRLKLKLTRNKWNLVALPGKFAKYIIFKLVYFEKLEEFVEKTNNGRQNIESKPDGWKT